jgi:hypothetical protein
VVPGSFWIDESDGTFLAHAQAIGLGSKYMASLNQSKLLQSTLQESPGDQTFLSITTLGFRLITTQENVPSNLRNIQRIGNGCEFICYAFFEVFHFSIPEHHRLSVRK